MWRISASPVSKKNLVKFQQLNDTYEILSDPEKKGKYDGELEKKDEIRSYEAAERARIESELREQEFVGSETELKLKAANNRLITLQNESKQFPEHDPRNKTITLNGNKFPTDWVIEIATDARDDCVRIVGEERQQARKEAEWKAEVAKFSRKTALNKLVRNSPSPETFKTDFHNRAEKARQTVRDGKAQAEAQAKAEAEAQVKRLQENARDMARAQVGNILGKVEFFESMLAELDEIVETLKKEEGGEELFEKIVDEEDIEKPEEQEKAEELKTDIINLLERYHCNNDDDDDDDDVFDLRGWLAFQIILCTVLALRYYGLILDVMLTHF